MSINPSSFAVPDTRPDSLGHAARTTGIGAAALAVITALAMPFLVLSLVLSIVALAAGGTAIVLGIIVVLSRSHGFTIGGIVGIITGILAGFAWVPLIMCAMQLAIDSSR